MLRPQQSTGTLAGRTRRAGLHPLVSAFLLLCVGSCARETVRDDVLPEIVMIVVLDTLGSGHISHLGYDRPTTPALDALARDGVSFTGAVTPASYTVATIPSIMTGRLPNRHGVIGPHMRMREEEVTLAEVFQREGFKTFAAMGVINGGPLYGNEQGFDECVEMYKGSGDRGEDVYDGKGHSVHRVRAYDFAPVISERLEKMEGGERLLLYMHMLEPHGPYDPPMRFKTSLTDARFPGAHAEGDREILQTKMKESPVSRETISEVEHLYDTNVLYADYHLGLLIEDLKRRGLYDKSLILVTADHGEAFWEHGRRGHGLQLYEEVVRVPLVVKFPKGQGPRNLLLDGLVSNMDILPSLCAWLGFDLPERTLDGISLAGFVADPDSGSPRESLFMRAVPAAGWFAIRLPTKKLIVWIDPKSSGGDAILQVELYELDRDPAEQENMAQRRPEVADRFRRRILSFLKEMEGGAIPEWVEIPAAEADLLRALGYLGGTDDL